MPMRKDAKVEVLRGMWLFSDCSRRELAKIATIAKEVDIPAGKAFIREGEPGREFFAVLEGTVEVRQGGRKVTTKYGGEFFGEIALILSAPRNATVVAVSPVKALAIGRSAFDNLLLSVPNLQLKLMRALAARTYTYQGDTYFDAMS